MGAISFTPEQRQVIEARNSTVLVSAAAGSGKTAVLVQRVLEKLLDPEHPQDINRLLVVTFTNAAAAQMKDRIGEKLSQLLSEPEFAGNMHLQKQALLLRNASITTMHGFCLSLLKEFFYELGLDPSFRIAEEGEMKLLSEDVLEELLEEYYSGEHAEEQELFLRLTECIGNGKNDEPLVDVIKKIDKFVQSTPFPESFLKKTGEQMRYFAEHRTLSKEDPCLRKMAEQMHAILEDCLRLSEHTLTVCEEPDGPAQYVEAIQDDIEFFRTLSLAEDYDAIQKVLEQHPSFARLSSKKSNNPEEKKELVKKYREEYKKIIEDMKKNYYFASKEQMAEDMAAMAPLTEVLLSLCAQYEERMAKVKAERGILDFSDLEHYAVRLLVRETPEGYEATETARQIRGRFDEIMMDECQDSNAIQDLLTESISGEAEGRPNRFMVGDVKQSIYKFRMAMPELFMKKYEEYKEEGPYRKIVLGRNFRSRASVVDYVNDVFSKIMRQDFGGIAYDDAARLYCHAPYPADTESNRTELILTSLHGEEDDETEEKVQREAFSVGGRIRQLMQEPFLVTEGEETLPSGEKVKKKRPIRYGDIMILFRAMSGNAEQYLEVFSRLGIPAMAETQNGYYQAQEVCVTLNALRILDNPRQDIPLVSVLHSELVGMTEEELATVRVVTMRKKGEPKLCFFEALEEFIAVTGEADQKELPAMPALAAARSKLLDFFSWYRKIKEKTAYEGVPELLADLFELTHYPDYVRVKQGGERRYENLRMLVEKAKTFEETSYSGIFDFIRYVERLVKYKIDSGEAQTVGSTNAVRLMSIHKSKGLEAPVVFVVGLSKGFNQQDTREQVVLHAELGIGMKYRDEVLRVEAPTLYKKTISDCLKRDMLAEELRILYVALTRAQEKLILSAAVKKTEEFWEQVEKLDTKGEPLRLTRLLSFKCYRDLLIPTIGEGIRKGILEVRTEKPGESGTGAAVLWQEEQQSRRINCLKELQQRQLEKPEDEELLREFTEREGFLYPYPHYIGKRKLSVSELKKAAYEEEEQEELFAAGPKESLVPQFARKQEEETSGLSGSERGTLYHRVMECMDFCKEYRSREEILEELDRLGRSGRVRPDAAELISLEKLLQFFASGLYARMHAAALAGTLQKEHPFVVGIPYEEIYEKDGSLRKIKKKETKFIKVLETSQEPVVEYIMVQGIIDACFEEKGKLVLVDYKTDAVKSGVCEELTRRYRTQMDYYERALTQMTEKEVSERIIYAFTNGEAFSVERTE